MCTIIAAKKEEAEAALLSLKEERKVVVGGKVAVVELEYFLRVNSCAIERPFHS